MNMVWVDCEGTIWETEIKRTFFAAGASEPFPVSYPQGTFWAWHFPQLLAAVGRCICLLVLILVRVPPSHKEWLSSSHSASLLRRAPPGASAEPQIPLRKLTTPERGARLTGQQGQ